VSEQSAVVSTDNPKTPKAAQAAAIFKSRELSRFFTISVLWHKSEQKVKNIKEITVSTTL
jgi:hypothetical protein